jgi:glutamate--cysteine ligase
VARSIAKVEEFFKTFDQHVDELSDFLQTFVSACGYPIYTSIDIRDAGWKTCAVDVNLFPAGFNKLDPVDFGRAADRLRQFLSAKLLKPGPWTIALVPEAHTNNKGYLDHLTGIIEILERADCQVRLAWSGVPIPKAWTVATPSGKELHYLPMTEALDGVSAVILNHDLSGGMIPSLREFLDRTHTPCFPNPALGWYRRRKSDHFDIVKGLLKRIEDRFEFFDSFYFLPKSRRFPIANFQSTADRERLADEASNLLQELQADYTARGIPASPRLIVKNNAGTYGIGVLSIQDPQELVTLSRSDLNKMRSGKESVQISDIMLQEAIPTSFVFEKTPGNAETKVAGEPTLYLINGLPVGGFMRIHEKLGAWAEYQNLNQPGSILETISSVTGPRCSDYPFPKQRMRCPKDEITMKSVYYFLCKLHATAAGLEECPSE